MSSTLEQKRTATSDIDGDGELSVAVPVEGDPFFSKEDVERIRKKAAQMNPSNSISMTFEQLYAVMDVFKK